MDIEEAKEAAEEFFEDREIEVDGETVSMGLASAWTDDETLFLKFTLPKMCFEDGEVVPDGIEAAQGAVDEFKKAYPEFEDAAIELEFKKK